MLVDLTPSRSRDPVVNVLNNVLNPSGRADVVRIQQGIYQMNHWNPEFCFREKLGGDRYKKYDSLYLTEKEKIGWNEEQVRVIQRQRLNAFYKAAEEELERLKELYRLKYKQAWPSRYTDYSDEYTYLSEVPEYGVIDYPTQILEIFPHLADDEIKRAITCVEIRREDQEPWGGWRYHKWGPYLGFQKPQNEYLYDDKHIDVVWTFHIYEVETDDEN